MRIACGEAETQLRLSSEASQSLLDRAESLRSERYDNVCLERISAGHLHITQGGSRDAQIYCHALPTPFHAQ